MAFCKSCGKEVAPGIKFCANCGASVNSEGDQHYQQPPQQNSYQAPNPESKSKLAAGLLGIFLGTLGIHNFYLGYKGKAIAQLVLFIIGCITSFLIVGIFIIIAVEIWAFIEGIVLIAGGKKTDAKGIPLV